MKTIWIDVSDIAEWAGSLTGIQRVSYMLSKQYFENQKRLGLNIRYTAYDKIIGTFYEIDFDSVITAIENPDFKRNFKPGVSGPQELSFAKRAYNGLLPRVAIDRINKARDLRGQKKRINMQRTQLSGRSINEEIKKGDVILVPGANWENQKMLAAISEKVQNHGVKYVQVVFDLIPVLKKEMIAPGAHANFKNYIKFLSENATHVLAISESTKNDLLKLGKFKGNSVSVFRLGEDFSKVENPKKPNHDVDTGNFLLCVGTFEARKNHALLYYMVKDAQLKNKDFPQVVIVGRQGWLTNDLEQIIKRDETLKGKIVLVHDGSDEDLSWFYQNCKFTIYPSFYEGWGLPIAESLFYGKLCFPSSTSSMQEIAGDLIEYFSPYNPQEASKLVEKYYNDNEALQAVEKKISKEYKVSTWDQAFQQVNSQINKLIKEGK